MERKNFLASLGLGALFATAVDATAEETAEVPVVDVDMTEAERQAAEQLAVSVNDYEAFKYAHHMTTVTPVDYDCVSTPWQSMGRGYHNPRASIVQVNCNDPHLVPGDAVMVDEHGAVVKAPPGYLYSVGVVAHQPIHGQVAIIMDIT